MTRVQIYAYAVWFLGPNIHPCSMCSHVGWAHFFCLYCIGRHTSWKGMSWMFQNCDSKLAYRPESCYLWLYNLSSMYVYIALPQPSHFLCFLQLFRRRTKSTSFWNSSLEVTCSTASTERWACFDLHNTLPIAIGLASGLNTWMQLGAVHKFR